MQTVIDYDVIDKLQEIDRTDFGTNSCYDYIDSLVREGEKYGVIVFVEPCGNITKLGNSWLEVLTWWTEVFRTQPVEWDYAKAGWHLYKLTELPANPQDAWTLAADV